MPVIPKCVKYDHNFAGVGAGHARDQEVRGHGPLLQLALLLMQIGISSLLDVFIAMLRGYAHPTHYRLR